MSDTTLESVWQGRDDALELGDTRRLFQIVRNGSTGYSRGEPVLLGFACDAGVKRNKGRPGAMQGPHAIRSMLAGLPAHDMDVLWDAGDVCCRGDELEQAQAELSARVAQILGAGARPVILGGGHEVAWGSFGGLNQHLNRLDSAVPHTPKPSVLIVNLDAHFDLRTSRPGTSGTSFDQILEACQHQRQPIMYSCFGVSRLGNTKGLFEHARKLGVVYIEDTQMQERHLDQSLAQLDQLISRADHVYLTIDLDVLPAAVAPGVSAPNAFGVPMCVIEACAQRVKASGKLRLADIAEINPLFDIDNHTARAAARLAWGLLAP